MGSVGRNRDCCASLSLQRVLSVRWRFLAICLSGAWSCPAVAGAATCLPILQRPRCWPAALQYHFAATAAASSSVLLSTPATGVGMCDRAGWGPLQVHTGVLGRAGCPPASACILQHPVLQARTDACASWASTRHLTSYDMCTVVSLSASSLCARSECCGSARSLFCGSPGSNGR